MSGSCDSDVSVTDPYFTVLF